MGENEQQLGENVKNHQEVAKKGPKVVNERVKSD